MIPSNWTPENHWSKLAGDFSRVKATASAHKRSVSLGTTGSLRNRRRLGRRHPAHGYASACTTSLGFVDCHLLHNATYPSCCNKSDNEPLGPTRNARAPTKPLGRHSVPNWSDTTCRRSPYDQNHVPQS